MDRRLTELFAVVASYLVLTISVASAATLTTYDPDGFPSGAGDIYFDPWGLVKNEVSVDPGSLMVQMRVANATPSVKVEGVWVYKCKDAGPLSCIDSIFYVPDHSSGAFEQSYPWSGVSGGSPETANLLYFVKVSRDGIPTWMGFWSRVTRGSPSSFSVTENDIARIGVYAEKAGLISTIREFINRYSMIPANPTWVSKVVFEGATGIWEISISGEGSFSQPTRPGTRSVAGNEVGAPSDDYGFMVPVTGSPANPATLHLNPSTTCGMMGCEPGEEMTCCLDCGCSAGYYCDGSGGCKQESGIGLSLYGSVNPAVLNCYESHVVHIPVQVQSPPSSYIISEGWCKLGGAFSQCPCTAGPSNVYVCEVTVPPVSGCGSGEFRITDNSVRLKISYMDGSVSKAKFVEAGFSDVTVGSFECGVSGCEAGLGEDHESCCLDCGCPSGYCDYGPGMVPGNATCRADPLESDVYVGSMGPLHFLDHNPPEDVGMDIVIANSPVSLEVTGASCSMGCVHGGGDCTSSCSVSFSEQASSDPLKHNLSVPLKFSVSGYSALNDYVLSPELTLDVRYSNGTSVVQKTLVKPLNQISVGAHWCGDGVPQEGEASEDCCFDAGCPAGQYCDTQSLEGPTEGDGCRQDSFQAVLDNVGSLDLVDSSISHEVPVVMHVSSFPTGTGLKAVCSLADGDVPCSISCLPVSSSVPTEYNMSCTMTIPAIDHVNSPYFYLDDRELRFGGNSINMTLSYNDGWTRKSVTTQKGIGNVKIEVTSRCGEYSVDPDSLEEEYCETWLGEDQANCCRDCGCSDLGDDYVCYEGASPNGECLSSSLIALKVNGFKLVGGSEPRCIIGRYGGSCKFIETHIANSTILNSPPDVDILSSTYRLGDSGNFSDDMNCVPAGPYGTWDCGFLPETVEIEWDATDPAGTELDDYNNVTFEMKLGISYLLNSTLFVDNVSDTAVFPIMILKSTALMSCDERIESLKDQINRIRANQRGYNDFSIIYMLSGTAMIILGIFMVYVKKPPDPIGWWLIAMGGLQLVLSQLGGDTGDGLSIQIEHIENMIQKSIDACSAPEFGDSATAVSGLEAMPGVPYSS